MDIKFIREKFTPKNNLQELNEIVDVLKEDKVKEKDADIGERFIRALVLGSKTLHIKQQQHLRQKSISLEQTRKLIRPIAQDILLKKQPKPLQKHIVEKSIEGTHTLLVSDKKVLAKASIKKQGDKYSYTLTEPIINQEMLKKVKEDLIKKYKKNKSILENDKLILKRTKKACKKVKLEFTDDLIHHVKYYLYRDLANFGKIDPLMHDHKIKTIICEGVNKPITIEYLDKKIETNVVFNSNEELNNLIKRFAEKTNQDLNSDIPILNVKYHEFRIQATLGLGVISSRFVVKRELDHL
tara:strand:- start:7556 stop:8446 length:891 start_codon:yes stop_codon:yes gene_type:complete